MLTKEMTAWKIKDRALAKKWRDSSTKTKEMTIIADKGNDKKQKSLHQQIKNNSLSLAKEISLAKTKKRKH